MIRRIRNWLRAKRVRSYQGWTPAELDMMLGRKPDIIKGPKTYVEYIDTGEEELPYKAAPVWEGGTEGSHTAACDGEPHPGQPCPIDWP